MFRTLIRDPWFKVGVALILSVAAITAWANVAAATNINVSASARCVNSDAGRYDVTATAHNTYSQTLHVRVDNPNSPIMLTLAPAQSWSYTFHVALFQPWLVKFTSSDGILVGQTLYQFTFRDVCGTPPPPPSTTSSTTCDRANPPRTDCPPSDTTVVVPPSTVATSTAPTPPTSRPVTSAPAPPSTGAGSARATTTTPHNLPVTGDDPWKLVVIAVGAAFIGFLLVAGGRR